MKTLAHISDLHFGAERPEVARGLVESLSETKPSLVVVSGDLTQRATVRQYRNARVFLDRMPFPRLIVPGNHDISLSDPFRRFLLPLHLYKRCITADLAPFFLNEDIAVLGINTARSLTWKNGRISVEQMELIRKRFCPLPDKVSKVLVTHHPFLPPPGKRKESVVGRARRVFLRTEGCHPDLALAGHFHMSYSGGSHSVYTDQKGSTLVIQAGTAISRRTRGEQNAYNLIRIEKDRVCLVVYVWNGVRFEEQRTAEFRRVGGLWV